MNFYKTLRFIFLMLSAENIFCKKIVQSNSLYKDKINKTHWFRFAPLKNVLQKHSEISYEVHDPALFFNFKSFPLSIDYSKQPHQGYLLPTFLLRIPGGIVQGMQGLVLIDNQCINEMIWRDCPSFYMSAHKINLENIIKVTGRVAVITQPAYENYFHWMTEILARLAFLDLQGIQYDYVYVPQKSKFMKETLQLWGVLEEKIIAPTSEDFAIQADEIILPSLVSNSNYGWTQFVNYVRPDLITFVKNKLLTNAQKSINKNLSRKVFISRKDAPFRKVINEDEVFEKFKCHGFERYELSKLSVVEQIMLFHGAHIIISPQGTGLANSIFCTSQTKIIELFQGLCDCTFWYISQIFNLNYTPIQTVSFEYNFFKAWQNDTYMSLQVIEEVEKSFNRG
ncbi:glycosyltransferase family 61 protein [Candidatus Dependentiae bacterium]|nr:glycosyltransferase family 61 protein [Candidatus Dependentiae bacterium]